MITVIYRDADGDLMDTEFDTAVDYWEWLTYSAGIELVEVRGL